MSHDGGYLLRCPRCGLDNASDVTECGRCGLPVYGPPPVPPPPGQQPPGEPATGRPTSGEPATGQPPHYPADQPPGSPAQQSPYGHPAPPATDAPSWGPQWPSDPAAGGHPGSPSPAGVGEQPGPATYGIGNVMPPGPAATDQSPMVITQPMRPAPTTGATPTPARSALARVVLALALIATVVYAVWELTARRAIFADFAAARTVTYDRARTNDRIDNVLLAIAASLAVIAFLVWLVRRVRGRTAGGGLDAIGLTLWLLGAIAAAVGLLLLETVDSTGGALAAGRHAETDTIVAGIGFAVIALSLVIGISSVGMSRRNG